MTIDSFNEITAVDVEQDLLRKIKEKIEQAGKKYILSVDENEYKNYLINEFTYTPLEINFKEEIIEEPTLYKENIKDTWGHSYEQEVYKFTVKYSYTGSELLFRVRPNSWIMTSAKIVVTDKFVSISFKVCNRNVEEFNREKERMFRCAFANLDNVNEFINEWNKKLPNIIASCFQQQKQKYLAENDFFTAINVKINDDTKYVFTVPAFKKKIIPQPTISKKNEIVSEPTVSDSTYHDALKVIYDLGKSMEKKPSQYKDKNEESLRDNFLLFLENRYEATTATGETFNRSGKTDIMLKYANDNSNIFVAECKFWHGKTEFHKAISQLLGYLTWRDSKTALILFVKNNDFSDVIKTIKKEAQLNPHYIKENGCRGETSFSYIFKLPQDKDKHIFLEIIAFHFDK